MKRAHIIASLWLVTATYIMAAAPQTETADSVGGITIGAHGMADAVIPLWQNEEGVVFFNPRISFKVLHSPSNHNGRVGSNAAHAPFSSQTESTV